MGRTWMSTEEVRRAGILERVRQGELKQIEAAQVAGDQLSANQAAGEAVSGSGSRGLSARQCWSAIATYQARRNAREGLATGEREHHGGGPGERFGPTLAAEHLEKEHGIEIDHETLRRWMRERDCGAGSARVASSAHGGPQKNISASYCRWTAAFTTGWRSEPGAAVLPGVVRYISVPLRDRQTGGGRHLHLHTHRDDRFR